MAKTSVLLGHGRPITKPSGRKTDRAPHMGRYVRIGTRFGKVGCHIVVSNQGFFYPLVADDSLTKQQIKAHTEWLRDMLCIALDTLVELEIKRRSS